MQTSTLPMFDAASIGALVSMGDAIEALRTGFALRPSHAPRTHLTSGGAEFLAMPAVSGAALGTKLITIQQANAGTDRPIIQGLYVLFSATDGRPVALFDGAALTNLRTPAASALATDALARADVRTIGVIGTGPQALRHPGAIRQVRPGAATVVVAARNDDAAASLADRLRADGFDVSTGSFDDAAACDVVCACTRATAPLFASTALRPGTHLNLVGSYRLDLREVDAATVAMSTVVVDDLAAAKAEAGDLAMAVDEGEWSWDSVAGDLSDVAVGRIGRTRNDEVTLFKSVGLAVQDVIVAYTAAVKAGLVAEFVRPTVKEDQHESEAPAEDVGDHLPSNGRARAHVEGEM